MNFFTDELKKITDRSEYIKNPKFVGKSCVFKLSNDVTGKLEFVTGIVADNYNALRLKLFNKSEVHRADSKAADTQTSQVC